MTVGTHDLTFLNFGQDDWPFSLRDHLSDVVSLGFAVDVVEFQHHRVGFSANNTWMFLEIIQSFLAILNGQNLLTVLCSIEVLVPVVVVVLLVTLAGAHVAGGLSDAFRFVPELELLNVFLLLASSTDFCSRGAQI